jgi:hypothetical protein
MKKKEIVLMSAKELVNMLVNDQQEEAAEYMDRLGAEFQELQGEDPAVVIGNGDDLAEWFREVSNELFNHLDPSMDKAKWDWISKMWSFTWDASMKIDRAVAKARFGR